MAFGCRAANSRTWGESAHSHKHPRTWSPMHSQHYLELLDKVPLPYVLHFRSDQVQTLNRVVSPPQLLIHRGQALSCSFHKPLCSNFPWHLLPASSPSLPFLMLLPLQEPGSKHGKTWGVEFRYSTVRLALTAAPRWLTMSPTDWRMAGERPFVTKDNCYPISIHH